jgi:hypothetical protein
LLLHDNITVQTLQRLNFYLLFEDLMTYRFYKGTLHWHSSLAEILVIWLQTLIRVLISNWISDFTLDFWFQIGFLISNWISDFKLDFWFQIGFLISNWISDFKLDFWFHIGFLISNYVSERLRDYTHKCSDSIQFVNKKISFIYSELMRHMACALHRHLTGQFDYLIDHQHSSNLGFQPLYGNCRPRARCKATIQIIIQNWSYRRFVS